MKRTFALRCLLWAVITQSLVHPTAQLHAQDWPAYGRDGSGARYAPLAQITRDNVNKLQVAWTYRTGANEVKGRAAEKAAFEATPILIDGTLYLSTPYSTVIALDPATGQERWKYDAQIDLTRNYSEVTSRGVSSWPASAGKSKAAIVARRIFIATLDARLIALDAATGKPCVDFGASGEVDLKRDVNLRDYKGYLNYQVTSPPAVIGDLVIVGSSIGDNGPPDSERGVVRAFNAITGKQVWAWDPIPRDAKDRARKTWADTSADRNGAANAWSIISVDEKRGLVFVPTSSPSPDFYGGARKGDNRYANSVVALRATTGKVAWSFQVVHHDLWDYDVAAQPMLVEIKRDGKLIPAVVAATKMGMLFVLHRETGKPLFPVEERPVPPSDVPGEQASATQPFPRLPRSLVPQRLTPDDAWGFNDAERVACREKIASFKSGSIYTPPSLQGTVFLPGNVGGVNWGGMAYDPTRNLLLAANNRLATVVRLIPREEFGKARKQGADNRLKGEFGSQDGTPYGMYREVLMSPMGIPCNAPPWGALSAVDLATGKLKWEKPLGYIPQAGMIAGSKEWGSITLGGPIVTAGGLAFVASTFDPHLRAFDVESGKELWTVELPAAAQATPMSYQVGGKQYVVICAGGHGKLGTKRGDHVVAFALPQ